MTDLVDVHLLELPVPLWSQAQQQTDELMREFVRQTAGAALVAWPAYDGAWPPAG